MGAIPWPALIAATLGLRLLISLIGAGTLLLLPQAHPSGGPAALLLGPWRHFDAIWFTQIASQGYASDPLTTAYMPLYPLLIHLVAIPIGGHYLTAGLIVSNLSLVAATGLIWRWVAEIFDAAVAWRTVVALLLFPDAFFLVGAYSESTFLALAAGCLLAVRRDRLLLAGALAALAALTRLQGLVLVVPIALTAWPLPRDPRRIALVLCSAAIPPAGFALYQHVLTHRLRGAGVFDTYGRRWHIPLQAPWQTLWRYVQAIRSPQFSLVHSHTYNYIIVWYLLIALLGLGVILASARRLGWQLTIFGVAGWCFMMTRWYSTGRYTLSLMPFFIAIALWADSRARFRRLAMGSLLVLVFFTAEFAQNSWVD